MKSPTELLQPLLEDLGSRCGTSTTQDLKTVLGRIEHEGLSFLTITLANFGRDFEKSLDQGSVTLDQFPGFARTGGLPRFLGGFLECVFDRKSARLLDYPSIDAIFAVRQFTLMFSKIALPCTETRTRKAISGYVQTEQDVRLHDANASSHDLADFARVGRLLWSRLLTRVDVRIHTNGVLPKHGPGATADRLRGNSKYDCQLWTSRLESEFPHWEYLIPNARFLDRTEEVSILPPGEEMAVRVITVPKTLKTPRIIAVEPTAMQYMQQGILETMVEEIARDDFARNLVMFERQEPNQVLAKEGSLTGALATLDLSEASDRVSNQHVRALVANHRALRNAVDATRSRKAELPGDGGVIRLAKFASMGSALCFPFEALVFTTIIFLGIERELNRVLTREDVRSLFGKVRVYGDDIIVPVEYVQSVIRELETFGFRVNVHKSFWTGKFRESCGKDYYAGHDVSIVKMRSMIPETRQHVEQLESTVSFRNHLFHKGFLKTVDALDKFIGNVIPFPIVDHYFCEEAGAYVSSSTVLGRHDYGPCQAERHDSHLHRPLVKGVVVTSQLPISRLDDYGALMKWFLKRGDKPFEESDHLQRAGRPVSARIKTRWASPF